MVEDAADGPARLRFKLAQNDSVRVPFTEFTLPIDDASVAGYVALTGVVLQLDDAYVLPPGSPLPRQSRLRRAGPATAPSPCWSCR